MMGRPKSRASAVAGVGMTKIVDSDPSQLRPRADKLPRLIEVVPWLTSISLAITKLSTLGILPRMSRAGALRIMAFCPGSLVRQQEQAALEVNMFPFEFENF